MQPFSVHLSDKQKLRSLTKRGGFQVKPLDFLGTHSVVKWKPVSAVGQGEGSGQGSLCLVQAGGWQGTAQRGSGFSAPLPAPPELESCLWKALRWDSLTQKRSPSTCISHQQPRV